MTSHLIQRFSAPVPRYTSYPTAPNFSDTVQAGDYARWLSEISPNSDLSLYFHIPFCSALCWYCGCATKAVARYEPVATYMDVLLREVDAVGRLIARPHKVTHIHWGGGSPNILAADDILRLDTATRQRFDVSSNAELAVEIDPRQITREQVAAFAAAGVSRVSIGVQDFSPVVQAAINRMQDFEDTKRAIDLFRDAGVRSVNIDLVYGLPGQTLRSLADTVERVISLKPDRLAVFGYAHLPSRFRHQRLINEAMLPDASLRYELSRMLGAKLVDAGYCEVGLDHYAIASDALASRALKRNFQGYTVDTAEALVGLGLSAIGQLPQGFVQNAATMSEYRSRVEATGLATVRGFALSDEDRIRASVIERLMCEFAFSVSSLSEQFGSAATSVLEEAEAMLRDDHEGLLTRTSDGFAVTEQGRPFVRSICARFDTYLGGTGARHAPGV